MRKDKIERITTTQEAKEEVEKLRKSFKSLAPLVFARNPPMMKKIYQGPNGGLFWISVRGGYNYLTPKQTALCKQNKLPNSIGCPKGFIMTRSAYGSYENKSRPSPTKDIIFGGI